MERMKMAKEKVFFFVFFLQFNDSLHLRFPFIQNLIVFPKRKNFLLWKCREFFLFSYFLTWRTNEWMNVRELMPINNFHLIFIEMNTEKEKRRQRKAHLENVVKVFFHFIHFVSFLLEIKTDTFVKWKKKRRKKVHIMTTTMRERKMLPYFEIWLLNKCVLHTTSISYAMSYIDIRIHTNNNTYAYEGRMKMKFFSAFLWK